MRIIDVPRGMAMNRLLRLLTAAGVSEAALVIPANAKSCRDPIDLELLALYAREHAWRIVLVTDDAELRERAALAGLRAEAMPPPGCQREVAAGSESRPGLPLPPYPWLLGLVTLAAFLTALYLIWPRPTVVVSPARLSLSLTAQAKAAPKYRDNQISANLLPARLLVKSGLVVYDAPATGSRLEGVTPAKGLVTFLNEGEEPVLVPAGAIVQTAEGLRFRTGEAVTVPAAKQSYLLGIRVSSASGQAQVEVSAETPGSQGNIGPGKIRTLLGPQGHLLRVINTDAFKGGTDRRIAVVSEEDVSRANEEARRQMELQAPEELAALAGTDTIRLPESLAIKPGQSKVEPAVGEAADSVRVTLSYNAQCLVLSRGTLAKFLEEQAYRRMPENFTLERGGFDVQEIAVKALSPEEVELSISARFNALGRLERGRILAAIKGRTEAEARAALIALPEVETVQMGLGSGRRFPRYGWLIKLVFPVRNDT